MNSWNHRVVVVNTDDGTEWGIYEVYYDDDGNPIGRTESPAVLVDERPKMLLEGVSSFLRALTLDALNDMAFQSNRPDGEDES